MIMPRGNNTMRHNNIFVLKPFTHIHIYRSDSNIIIIIITTTLIMDIHTP